MNDAETGNARSIAASGRVALVIAALLLVYVVSPYFAFWRFTAAIENRDKAALDARVDFAAVRTSLKEQIRARFIKPYADGKRSKADRFTSLVMNLAPSLVDSLVDAYVTPDGLAAIVTDPPHSRDAHALADLQARREHAPAHRSIDWKKVRYAFFTGPTSFMVDLDGAKLRFGFTGVGWRLREVDLPLDDAG
jgi:hypothetical protein